MKLHEYQAKQLFHRYSVPVPEGITVLSPTEALSAARQLDTWPLVLKSQIHAGGRGKGGGIRIVSDEAQVTETAENLFNTKLVTSQTGSAGQKVQRILVEQGIDISEELYLSIMPDRHSGTIMIIASTSGGVEIEAVADASPEKIIKVSVDPLLLLQPFQCRRVAFGLQLAPELQRPFADLLANLFRLFVDNDCSLVEVNPLAVTGDNRLVALDAKIDLDDNGLFRHPELAGWRDESAMDPLESRAARAGLNYIRLDGEIGILVNGAGLAMATMDLIKEAGAMPANFLDVGGGASRERIEEGFRIILADPRVRGILVNIFGGILRCDLLAEGIVAAARETRIRVPLVIRMEGTNAAEGRKILAESGLEMITALDLAAAAEKIANVVKRGAET